MIRKRNFNLDKPENRIRQWFLESTTNPTISMKDIFALILDDNFLLNKCKHVFHTAPPQSVWTYPDDERKHGL